jgi:iron uptake system EfeUOB component EfeO/EfeM
MSARYMIETVTGKQIELEDFMMTENGIEGIQVDADGQVTTVLITEGGMVIYDRKSDKTRDSIQKSRDAYKAMVDRQQAQFKARTQQMVDAEDSSEESTIATEPRDEDGPMFELPKLDEQPPGYA